MTRGAGVWRVGAAPSGVCGGLFWLVLQVRVSRAVLCRSVPRRVALCCGALHCGVLRCGVPCCLCVVPWWVCGSVEVSVAGRAVAPCVTCGAGVWRVGAAPSGVCGGLFWLVLPKSQIILTCGCRILPASSLQGVVSPQQRRVPSRIFL